MSSYAHRANNLEQSTKYVVRLIGSRYAVSSVVLVSLLPTNCAWFLASPKLTGKAIRGILPLDLSPVLAASMAFRHTMLPLCVKKHEKGRSNLCFELRVLCQGWQFATCGKKVYVGRLGFPWAFLHHLLKSVPVSPLCLAPE